jgi:hypothetical protein
MYPEHKNGNRERKSLERYDTDGEIILQVLSL